MDDFVQRGYRFDRNAEVIMRRDIRSGDDRWIFYGTTVVIVPVILGLFGRPETVSLRYLIVPAAFALLSISISVGRGLHRTGRIRLLALVSTALLVGLGLTHLRPINRGQYRSAISEMLAATRSEPVTVASADRFGGHAFRTAMVLNFYRRRMADGPQVSYVDANQHPVSGAEWMIVESPEPESGSLVYRDGFGRSFRLQREYLASEISGVTWHLYRRADDRPSSR